MNSANPTTPEETPSRIAVVGRLDRAGGVQSVMLSLIRGLNRAGIVPDLIWDENDPQIMQEWGVRANFRKVRFPITSSRLYLLPISARYILRTLNTFRDTDLDSQYDFYYIFANEFLLTSGAPHVRYLSGPPLIPQLEMVSPGIRGVPYRILRALYRGVLRRRFPVYEVHRNARYVINSEYTASLFEEAHGLRLPVVHPPIDLSGRTFTSGDFARRDTVTFFSRFAPYKRPEMVLDLAERYPDRRFVLMGGVHPQQAAYYARLTAGVEERGLNNVTFIESPPSSRLKEELTRARFFVFPARNEHFGMTTAEAVASGVIPFVHNSGGQREIVPDSRLRFEDHEFFEKFACLLEMPVEELSELQVRLSRHVHGFSEDAFIDKMLAFIR